MTAITASISGHHIPFNRPGRGTNEAAYVAEALASGTRCGDGPFTRRCQAALQAVTGAHRALLTTSCTDALELSALLLRLEPGDEVVVPAFTFVSTANAFAMHGARIVFCDIRPDTLNLDERLLPGLIGPRTRAVVVVHYAGIACELTELSETCLRSGIALIEDNAHGLFGSYRGRPLGSFGALATQSFHETKNLGCGEGGALLINDPGLLARAEILREKGTDRARFFRGEVDKYTWVDVGSSFLPSDILAAVLLAQLDDCELIQRRRQAIIQRYHAELAGWTAEVGAVLPVVPSDRIPAWHMFYVLMPDLAARQALIAHLKGHGITAVFHYVPLHTSPMGQRLGGRPGQCQVTERTSDRLLRLPLFNGMTDVEQTRVITMVQAFSPLGAEERS